MARQSTTPVSFNRSRRVDETVLMTSGRAGVVVPVGFVPLLAGDSAAGRVGIDIQLKEMPRPLLNAVHANVQAWFVPKSAMPQFAGRDELMHAMSGDAIKALGQPNREPPPYFFNVSTPADLAVLAKSPIFRSMGLHIPAGEFVNVDLIDSYSLIYNFRLAAHTSKLARRKYAKESLVESTTLARAFWPSSRLSRVVPDYDRALVVGSLDLDVKAGRLPVSGIGIAEDSSGAVTWRAGTGSSRETGGNRPSLGLRFGQTPPSGNYLEVREDEFRKGFPAIFAEMAGQRVNVSLADIDKARTTQAFAKLRTAYAGNDSTGFDNDDAIVSLLMQGLSVPDDQFKRPWLLDSARVPVGFAERHATNGADLDKSVTLGMASAQLSLNVPVQDVGGLILFTVEVLPERIDERMSDEWLLCNKYSDLPNALRDVQRIEPVDLVLNRRVDAKHVRPGGLYGYEPMNDKWNRSFTRCGGTFWAETPGAGWKENRAAIWQTEIKDPNFSGTHYLAPAPFPHDVFADQTGPAFEAVIRHSVTISGLTQIGDILTEHGGDYHAVVSES